MLKKMAVALLLAISHPKRLFLRNLGRYICYLAFVSTVLVLCSFRGKIFVSLVNHVMLDLYEIRSGIVYDC